MIWYFDLLLIFGLSIASIIALVKAVPKTDKTVAKTKDGYSVTVKQMLELEEKRAFGESVLKRKLGEMASDTDIVELLMTLYAFGLFVFYILLGNLIDHFFPVPNELFACAFVLAFFFIFYKVEKASMQEGVDFIKELTIEAPPEMKQYGAYVKNPFDIYGTMTKMKESEEKWERKKTRRDRFVLEAGENPSIQKRDELKKLDKELEVISKKITVQAGLLATNLMTDNPSDDIRSIIEANQKPDLARATKSVPHYIGVMKEIALNVDMPDDVREEAQELVNAYETKEIDREKEKEINEARLEIETVRKHIA